MYEKKTRYQDDGAAFSVMVRIGNVTAVDNAKRLAQVYFQDMALPSGWIPVLITNPWMPKVGEQVLCLYEPIRDGRGFVLGGIQAWQ